MNCTPVSCEFCPKTFIPSKFSGARQRCCGEKDCRRAHKRVLQRERRARPGVRERDNALRRKRRSLKLLPVLGRIVERVLAGAEVILHHVPGLSGLDLQLVLNRLDKYVSRLLEMRVGELCGYGVAGGGGGFCSLNSGL